MTIEIKNDTYYVGVWFLSDGATHDWLAVLSKPAGEPYRLDYRFRFYKDAEAHDSQDVKSFHTHGGIPDERTGRAMIDRVTTELIALGFAEAADLSYTDVNGGGDLFVERLTNAPFTHVRVEPALN